MVSVKRDTLRALLLAAKNTFPDEFIALLASKGKEKAIGEFVVLPAVFGEDFSSIRLDLLPFDKSIRGSVHSHPGGIALPSRGDKLAFRHLGETHLIIATPFTFDSVGAFDGRGKRIALEIVE